MQFYKSKFVSFFITFIVGVFCGIGRNLPNEYMVLYGVAPIDLILIISFLIILVLKSDLALNGINFYSKEYILIWLFSIFCYISMFINVYSYDIRISDFFEVIKYLLIPIYLTVYTILYKKNKIGLLMGYIFGLFTIGISAYLNPMNDDVLGTVQIYNPNVIGNVITFSCFFLILPLLSNNVLFLPLLILLLIIAFFTFSKAAWIMIIITLLSIYIYLLSLNFNKHKKIFLSFIFLIIISIIIVSNLEIINLLVQSKINATDFSASASQGGSFSARSAFLESSLIMFLNNPIFGVGISNWEIAHIQNKQILFEDFYLDDNPNSAFFYVLSCMGIICFVIYIQLILKFLYVFNKSVSSSILKFFAFLIVLISGNIQLEMLTAYYFWFFYSIYNVESSKNENCYIRSVVRDK